MNLITQILGDSKDKMINYECLICLRNLIKKCDSEFNPNVMIGELAPLAINLMQEMNHPNIIFNLIDFLNTLIEKLQFQCPEIILASIKTNSFQMLFENTNEIVILGLSDMFKNLLVSSPQKNQIFEVYSSAIIFIEKTLKVLKYFK
jgi:hypothetical protein